MDINLRDEFKISDSHSKIRGFLVIQDENGNIVLKKENMIVEAGRKYIRNLFLDKVSPKEDNSPRENRTVNTIKFGNGTSLVTPEDKNLEKYLEGVSASIKIDEETDKLCVVYKSVINIGDNSEPVIITEAGLFFDTVSDGENIFSKLTFAPLTLKPDITYNINYYIYF